MNKYVAWIFILVSYVALGCAPGYSEAYEQQSRLILFQNSVLNAFYDGKYFELKRAELFYGYGFLDESHVFMAYQAEGEAEASAVVEVLDIDSRSGKVLFKIGGVGESNFDISRGFKKIVFIDVDGVKLLHINLNDYSYDVDVIRKDVYGWGCFWIDETTIGYFGENGKFEKITIPSNRQTNLN